MLFPTDISHMLEYTVYRVLIGPAWQDLCIQKGYDQEKLIWINCAAQFSTNACACRYTRFNKTYILFSIT